MIDHRHLTCDPTGIRGITLMQDRHLGLNIIAEVQGGQVIASLNADAPFEVSFLKPDEGPGPRFFIPDCELKLDHFAAEDATRDPPLGSLIVAKAGISLMVKPPRGAPSPLRLTGHVFQNAYEGIAITRWRLVSSAQYGKPEMLYGFEYREQESA